MTTLTDPRPSTRGPLDEARALRASGRLEEAVAALRHAGESAEIANERGVILRELGRLDEAGADFRRAIGLAPGYAPYHANLGRTFLMLGRAADAVACFGEAAALAPWHAPFFTALGEAAEALGFLDEAASAYGEAARLEPGMAAAHHGLGAVLVRLGRYDEAQGPLEQAAALEPGDATHWENLATRHERAGRFDLAIAAWERAVAADPVGRADLHLALGRDLRAEGREDEAEVRFILAQAVEPASATPRIELGGLREDRGDFAGAEAAYREALAVDPSSTWAHLRLAWLLRGKLPEADLARLASRLDAPDLESDARPRLLYSLATVLDAKGDVPRAVALLREANALQVAENRAAGRGFDRESFGRFVDEMVAGFGPDFFVRVAGAGLDTPRPAFIVGLPRSGTTLVEQVLAAHPEVHGAGELRLARNAFDGLAGGSPGGAAARLDAPGLSRLAADYLARLDAVDGGQAARVVDKMPENYLYLGLIAAMFPRATIIHCRRDPRDTALSCWMTIFQSLAWTNDPADIAASFRGHARLMDHWRSVLPVAIHEVDYEETVSDLESVARRLVSALGLGWDPSCLDFHRAGRSVRTASTIQVREPVHRRSVGKWKKYEAELADLFGALAGEGLS